MKTKYISSTQAKKLAFNKMNLSFFKLADEVKDNFEKDGKIGMRDRLKNVFAKFEDFVGSKNATFYDIDEKVLIDFQIYLETNYENKINTIQSNVKSNTADRKNWESYFAWCVDTTERVKLAFSPYFL
jgi:hypothetical protein